MIPTPEGWSPRPTADYYLHAPRPLDRAALVHALMHTSFVVNTGAGVAPVGGSRPMTGTEAHDVADLVFGAAPDREGSPFADDQVLDDEPRHEVECPVCGATIRARMADAPDDDQEDDADDAPGLRALAEQPRRYSSASLPATPTPGHTGIDTCRHRQAPRVAPGYEISESGHVPED